MKFFRVFISPLPRYIFSKASNNGQKSLSGESGTYKRCLVFLEYSQTPKYWESVKLQGPSSRVLGKTFFICQNKISKQQNVQTGLSTNQNNKYHSNQNKISKHQNIRRGSSTTSTAVNHQTKFFSSEGFFLCDRKTIRILDPYDFQS